MQEEVHVGVDEAGEERGVAEIEHLRALRVLDGSGNFDDAIALHEDFSRRKDFSGVDFEETRGVEHDGILRRRGLGKERDGSERGKRKKTKKAEQRWACDHGRNHITRKAEGVWLAFPQLGI